jgi:DNA-binding NarL/FixJ family response regulator
MSVRVLLVDDQPLIRTGFRMILEVVGEADNGRAALQKVSALVPDVVLMDIRMPGMDGIEATRRLTAGDSPSRVLVLTTYDLDEYAYSALRAGASGFLLKDTPVGELVSAIHAVADGHAVVAPRITRLLLDTYAHRLPDADGDSARGALAVLTPRERDVLLEIARGLTNAEIATTLSVSEVTVKSHVGAILSKLHLRNRVAAVILAYELGLVD